MASTWGPFEHPMERGGRPVGDTGGAVTQPHASGGSAPHHDVSYNATDGRHSRESGLSPWKSVDPMSGPTSDTDFGASAGRFPDGPGMWRQT